MLGQPVAGLVDAGRVLAASSLNVACTTRQLLEYGLGLAPETEFDPDLIDEIVGALGAPGTASFADYVVQAFTHPRVVDAFARGGRGSDKEQSP